jgi:hypothetical protein
MVTVTLQCSVFSWSFSFELFSSLLSLSHCSVQCSSWKLSLWILQHFMFTVTLQCSVFLIVTVSSICSARYCYCHTAVFCVRHGQCNFVLFSSLWSLLHFSVQCSYSHCHFEFFSSLWSLSHCSVQCYSWSLLLWIFQLILFTVTLQCSVFLMVTAVLKFSACYGYCHTAVFSVSHGHCCFELFSSLMSLSHCSVQCSSCSLSL